MFHKSRHASLLVSYFLVKYVFAAQRNQEKRSFRRCLPEQILVFLDQRPLAKEAMFRSLVFLS